MAHHLVFIIMDSCRFDSARDAAAPNLARLGEFERRYSYASWTSPSHYAFLMGMIPHLNPQGVFASEVYKKEFSLWVDRLGIEGLSFKTFLPQLSLPKVLQAHGYRSTARVSLPVLNQFTTINRYFDDYKLMENHNDFEGMVNEIDFSGGQPQFYFLNLGETHYPYMLDPKTMPHISGVHGVFKRLGDRVDDDEEDRFFDAGQMRELHRQQVRCVEHVDQVLEALFAKAPANTHFIVTADHGELFGEGGFFGHGPIMHEKVFEVPYLEGRKP